MSSPDPEREVDLTPHRSVPRGDPAAEIAPPLTMVVGFVGSAPSEGEIRVYMDLSFASYYEIRAEDVVRTKQVDAADPDSPRALWIDAGARIGLVRVDRRTGPAGFLTGGLRERYRGRYGNNAVMVLPATNDPCTFVDCLPSSSLCVSQTCSDWCYTEAGGVCPHTESPGCHP